MLDRIEKANLDPGKFSDVQKDLLSKGLGAATSIAGNQINKLIDALNTFAGEDACRDWYRNTMEAVRTGKNCDSIYSGNPMGDVNAPNYGDCAFKIGQAGGNVARQAFEKLAKSAFDACDEKERKRCRIPFRCREGRVGSSFLGDISLAPANMPTSTIRPGPPGRDRLAAPKIGSEGPRFRGAEGLSD